jgi:hypothetical protein
LLRAQLLPHRSLPWLAIALTTGAVAAGAQPMIDGCPVFPGNNVWNAPVTGLPVAADSATLIANMNPGAGLHPDFGSGFWEGGLIGIPFDSVPAEQPLVPVDFATFGWPDESDPGPYPIPDDPQIEGEPSNATGDRHVLVLERGDCVLWETFYTYPHDENGCDNAGGWCAASGATWSLASNALRTDGWTSADAAGLPILPGLARYEEVEAGEIRHALRFTVAPTRKARVWPARHQAGSTTDPGYPPMGLRLRLRASVDLSGFSAQTRIVLLALQRYGMILADNGSDWYLSGVPDARWDNDQLVGELAQVHGSDFEVVDTSSLIVSADSAATPHLFSDGFEAGDAALGFWSSVSGSP